MWKRLRSIEYGFSCGRGDRDAVRLRVLDAVGARAQIPLAPRRDDAHARIDRHGGELEADLVVALAGRAVRDRVGAPVSRTTSIIAFAMIGSGDGRAEQVLTLVDRVRAEHREDEVAHELLAEVAARRIETAPVFFAFSRRPSSSSRLTDVGAERDDLGAVRLLEPREDDGGVEASAVREDDLLGLLSPWRAPIAGGSGMKQTKKSPRELLRAAAAVIRRVVTEPRGELSRWERRARFAYDLGRYGARKLRRDAAPQMAAALSYRTLFGLLPVLVVGTMVVRATGGFSLFRDRIAGYLTSVGLDAFASPRSTRRRASPPRDNRSATGSSRSSTRQSTST